MGTAGARSSRALYSGWSLVSTAISLVGLVLALGYLSDEAGGGLTNLAFALVIGIPAAWCTVRTPMMRVVLAPDVLIHHGLGRTRKLHRNDIAGVTSADTGNVTGEGRTPQLLLAAGSVVTLGCLASYSRARTAERVAAIEEWRAS